MDQEAATVEDDFFDAGFLCTFRDGSANFGSSFDVVLAHHAEIFSSVDAAARVTPWTSSITWTEMFFDER